jgi:hypothetical protein
MTTLQIGEYLWQSNGMIATDENGFGRFCTEVTEVTWDSEGIETTSVASIRANRTFVGLDPDTGLPPE